MNKGKGEPTSRGKSYQCVQQLYNQTETDISRIRKDYHIPKNVQIMILLQAGLFFMKSLCVLGYNSQFLI